MLEFPKMKPENMQQTHSYSVSDIRSWIQSFEDLDGCGRLSRPWKTDAFKLQKDPW